MAIYAIGDIHGCYSALKTLFKVIPATANDAFIFLGDYIDRGPNTMETIEWLINFSKGHNTVFLRGNHEIMMLAAQLDDLRLEDWKFSGGEKTLLSYGAGSKNNWITKVPDNHWEFLNNTKPYHQIGKFIFVHAGLERGKPLEEQNKHSIYWEKYEIPEKYSDNKIVICGHTSRKDGNIANFGHTICVDTYAYGGKWLTGINVTNGEYFQANEKKVTMKGTIEVKSI